jgi:hypothetical protein
LFTHCNFTDNIARLGNVAYTDDCNSSAITFNYSYFNPDKPNFNFIGLITNLNQIIPLNPPVMIQTTSSTVTENTTTIPIVKESNSTNSTTSFDPLNPKLPNNTIPIASLALSSISLLTTLALFLKPYLFKTSPQPVDSGMSQQVVGNSIITYDMLEKVEFQNRNSEVSRELNDLTEKIKHNPNCCPCCTSVLYMLSLLQGGIYISSTITRIEHWGKIMEFILGPLVAAYLFIKDIYFSFKNKWR